MKRSLALKTVVRDGQKADCQSKSEAKNGRHGGFFGVCSRPYDGKYCFVLLENRKQPQKQPNFYFHTGYGKEQVLYIVSS